VKILVVEDDRTVGQYVRRGLEEQRLHVDLVEDGLEGLRFASGGSYDLVILDLRLPSMTGLEVLRTLRDRGLTVPILVLTAQDAVDFKVQALRAGADDYVTKPFAFEELLARIRVQLRRRQRDDQPTQLRYGALIMDTAAHETHISGRRVELTAKEYELLELFMRHPQQVLTREVIYDRVWGYDFGGESNIIEVYVRYLRQKLESASEPRLIHTVRGVGYILREES